MEPVVKGHPVHPSLIPIPVGLFPASYMLDLLAMVTKNDKLADAAFYNMLIGAAGSVPAAVTGFMDYLQMEQKDPAHKTATTHGLMNAGAIVLYGVNLALRARNRKSKLGFLLSTVGVGGLTVSAYLGGEIAYGRGWRVRNAERFELQWQKEHAVGPFAPEGAPEKSTAETYPPATIKGFQEKKSGEAVLKDIQNGDNQWESGTVRLPSTRPAGTSSNGAQAASDKATNLKSSMPDNHPSQAEGERDGGATEATTRRETHLPDDMPSQAEGERDIFDRDMQNLQPPLNDA